MKKKLVLLAITTMMSLSMAACGEDKAKESTQSKTSGAVTENDESQNNLTEVFDIDEKDISETLTINICGVRFQLGDEWEPIKKQLEEKGIDFDTEEKKGIYHFTETDYAEFTYVTSDVDGKNVIAEIQYHCPKESKAFVFKFKEKYVTFNGYKATECMEFGEDYNLLDQDSDNNILKGVLCGISGNMLTFRLKIQ